MLLPVASSATGNARAAWEAASASRIRSLPSARTVAGGSLDQTQAECLVRYQPLPVVIPLLPGVARIFSAMLDTACSG